MNALSPRRLAITRDVSPSIGRCELTHLPRQGIDYELAKHQHEEYCSELEKFGFEVQRITADPSLPDSVFVEDTCVVLDEIAVIARPGAGSRRAETAVMAQALHRLRGLRFIEAPGTLDGGDVLQIGRTLYVGLSCRTNGEAVDQLRRIVSPCGYSVVPVPIVGCLHLKSAATLVAEGTILVNWAWVDRVCFGGLDAIEIDPGEPMGANALRIDDAAIYSQEFPRTRERLERRGIRVVCVDMSELGKAEGGVTCCSVLL